MAASPVAVLAVIGIYVAFFAVYSSSEATTYGLDQPQSFEEPDGLLDAILGIVHTVWNVITLILGALVFNVDGAPAYIQVPTAIIIISSLTWSVVTLIRGN